MLRSEGVVQVASMSRVPPGSLMETKKQAGQRWTMTRGRYVLYCMRNASQGPEAAKGGQREQRRLLEVRPRLPGRGC